MAAVADGSPQRGWGNNFRLGVYTVLLLLSSVGNQVYFKRMTSAMPNYGWYLTQLSTFVYVPIFAFLAGTGLVQHAKAGLLKKFAMMGIFDGLGGTMMVLGGVQTSGTLQVLLSQAVIPVTILLSMILLRKRYHCLQQTGAGIIVLGIILAKVMGSGGDGAVSGNNPVFNAIFFMAMVPAALSSVFKEVAFKGFDGDLDVNVLQFWVAFFQVAMNFLAMPIYTLSILGPQQVPISEMPSLMIGGTRCLFNGEDQISMHCGLPGEKTCDHCASAWMPVATYMSFNLMYNIFTILVIKHGSAALSFLVATLRMPLASLAFGSTLIMGSEAVPPGPSDVVSLVVIITGLCTYRYGGMLMQKKEALEESPAPSPATTASPSSPISRGSGLSEPLQAGKRKVSKWMFAPLFSTCGVPTSEPAFVVVRTTKVVPRSASRVRHDLYHRLGAASPLHSPQLRNMPMPPASPNSSPYASPRQRGPLSPPPFSATSPQPPPSRGWEFAPAPVEPALPAPRQSVLGAVHAGDEESAGSGEADFLITGLNH